MSLPTSRELREMLEGASPYPWKMTWGYIMPSSKDDVDLILIAPQLAEEVIRLREEIDDMADLYRIKGGDE